MSSHYSEQFRLLVRKYIDGTATPEEISIVEDYYKLFSDLPDVLDVLTAEERELLENKIRNRIAERIRSNGGAVVPLFKKWKKIAAAIIIIGSSLSLFLLRSQRETPQVLTRAPQHHDIAPGSNNAILTLADGRQVILDDASDHHLIAKESGITITKTVQGQLVYTVAEADQDETDQPAYNTIRTPSGGQYQVVLPDGSKVWLNAESALKYPTRFTGGSRNVELTGEAYFEIEKTDKKMPFNVAVNDMRVEVLGTHFNIMAYANERSINTTLLEGSVKVTRGLQSRLITPGQQVRVTDQMQVVNANVKEAVAWKEGYFLFEREDIRSIMRKISRWYDADVIYEGDVSGKYFGGKISRFRNVSEVLKMLELTGSIHFKIVPGDPFKNERRIIVMP